jgi:hypothetical protein
MSPKQSGRPASSRPTAKLGRHLEHRLLAYAAAASAGLLSSALPSEAEIIYTPSNTPFAVGQLNQGPAFTPLDLNNDGAPDFSFAMSSAKKYERSGTTSRFRFFLKIAPVQTGNGAVPGQQGPTASAVPAGVRIGPQQRFEARDLYLQISSFNNGVRSSGTWRDVEFAYVGLKFLINGQVHYGWARVKFPYQSRLNLPSIYGYAYESTPNQPIITGQTTGTLQEEKTSLGTLGTLAVGASGMGLWRGTEPANELP